jgi:hypothetical protein
MQPPSYDSGVCVCAWRARCCAHAMDLGMGEKDQGCALAPVTSVSPFLCLNLHAWPSSSPSSTYLLPPPQIDSNRFGGEGRVGLRTEERERATRTSGAGWFADVDSTKCLLNRCTPCHCVYGTRLRCIHVCACVLKQKMSRYVY